jgi:Right handed beta helix region
MPTMLTPLPTFAAALLALGFSAAPAQAGPNRTSVSGHGTDSGTCGLAAPCRTFAFALTQTAAGGEIDVLDPAGYGQVTITKAISILGNGAAGINAASGNGVTINAGASDSVYLRGLTIDGLGSGANGIQFTTGGNLEIENCVIRDFSGTGINIAPTGSAAVTGVLSNVITYNNPNGINVSGTALTGSSLNVTVVNSVASNSNVVGINAAGANTAVMVRNTVVSYSGTGLFAQMNAILRVGHSVVTGNNTGVNVATTGGTLFSYGDNDIDGNTNNNTAVLTSLAMH